MPNIVQRNFSAGEVSPDIEVRSDFVANQTGLRTSRNGFIRRQGGFSRRNGFEFCDEVKDSSQKVRLIPFQFSRQDSMIIEVGVGYFRFFKDGRLIRDDQTYFVQSTDGQDIETPGGSATLQPGDEVRFKNLKFDTGEDYDDTKYVVVSGAPSGSIRVQDTFGQTVSFPTESNFDTTPEIEVIYEVENNFLEGQLFELRFSQINDIMTLVHPDAGVFDLKRAADDSWTFSQNYLQGNIVRPSSVEITNQSGTNGDYSYEVMVATIDAQTGGESFPTYDYTAVVPKLDINDSNTWLDVDIEFDLAGPISRKIALYIREVPFFEVEDDNDENLGGFRLIDYIDLVGQSNTLTIKSLGLDGIDYGKLPLSQTLIYGETLKFDYDGTNGTEFNLFGQHPTAIATSKERRFYAGSFAKRGDVYASRVARYNDFKERDETALSATDPLQFNSPSEDMGRILHLLDYKRLFMFTETSVIVIKGSTESGAVSATDLPNPEKISGYGISEVRPLIVDKSVLYVESQGSRVFDLLARVELDDYSGDEISIFSSHLLDDYQVSDWTFVKNPHPIVWIVRDDGVLLSLTYNATQQIKGWSRHDALGGKFEAVASITEGFNDYTYAVVSRNINGLQKKYVERVTSKKNKDLKDKTYMDSYVTFDGRNKDSSLSLRISGLENGWDFGDLLAIQSNDDFFRSNMVGKTIFFRTEREELRIEIDSFTSGTEVKGYATKDLDSDYYFGRQSSDFGIGSAEIDKLDHLESLNVAVMSKGFVSASPLNPDYTETTVTDGKITLSEPTDYAHIGLSFVTDFETLDFDMPERNETMLDRPVITNRFNARVLETGGFFAGTKAPEGDDYLEGLLQNKVRENENYSEPNKLVTGLAEVAIESSYNIGGRVFVRQVDPLPLNILSVFPDIQGNS